MYRRLFLTFALVALATAAAVGQQPSSSAPPAAAQAPPPAAGEPQQPPVVFRAEVNYVEVDARVLDAEGRFVPGLSAGDFTVIEDGTPQAVTVFSYVNIPVERAERPLFRSQPIEPDVQTNVGSDRTGRVYLLVLDDLHTAPLRSAQLKAAAKRFVARYLGANDVAAVVHTSGSSRLGQEFTSNPRLLDASIDRFMGRKIRSATLGRLDQESLTRGTRQSGETIDDPDDAERAYQARNTLDIVKNLSEFLGGVSGRKKALIFFSEGIDYNINDPFGNSAATSIISSTRDAISAATRANVSIYAVDPRGIATSGDEMIEVMDFPTDSSLGLNSSAFDNEVRLGQDSLRVLSDETGGFAAVGSNDLDGWFRRIVEDNSSYYVLGYYPTNERRDGRFRKIEVRVSRPGLTVRARKGYAAARGRATKPTLAGPKEATEELREAVSSPLPVSDLPIAATAAVFKGPDRKGSVVISTLIGGRILELVEKGGAYHDDLEIVAIAVGADGKTYPGDRNTVAMNLKPESVPRVRAAGFRVISSLDLPPGRYQLRVAASEANGKRAGSVLYDLEVPDFTGAFQMSSLAVTSASSGLAPTARAKDPLAELMPGPLTTYRDFPTNDEIAVFAEVYDNIRGAAHKVDIAATVQAEDGRTVFQTQETRDSSELAGSAGGYGFTTRVPLKDLAPGRYVLRVEATPRTGDTAPVARETVFRVVAPPPGQP
ncbi:MAG: VWA domain-containing protein [Vicinamibacterales bacterium]